MTEAPRRLYSALRLAVASILVTGATLAVPPGASAAPLCALDSAARTLGVTAQASGGVVLAASAPYLTVNGSACALLNDVNSVSVDMAPAPSASLTFDLRGGPLGPGYLKELDGSSEIEFQIVGMTSTTDLVVYGSSGDDGIRVGQYFNKLTGVVTGQVNLNAPTDGATPDIDIAFTAFPRRINMYGENGNDVISAAGVGTLLSGAYGRPVFVLDGNGTDQVTGGSGDDVIATNPEPGRHGDVFSGGAGIDTYSTGGSYTQVAAIRLDGLANDGLECPGSNCAGNNVGADFEIVEGSPANEFIVGDADPEVLVGGGGVDIIKGLGGNDTIRNQDSTRYTGRANGLFGGPGDDLLFASLGAPDTFQGGGGIDTVSFAILTAGAVVTLDGAPNDGMPGMDADVADDVERIIGTGFADSITGNVSDDALLGGPGPDTLFGLGGNDTLQGQGGNDDLNGGPGTDTCAQGGGTGTITACEA
jgi:Ca2+-binding RTX toxin-like protein